MPPHLHPRSRTTSSLFATTVAASFLVVGLPHLLPCPRPVTRRLDGAAAQGPAAEDGQMIWVDENGRVLRRQRKKRNGEDDASAVDKSVGSQCGGSEEQAGGRSKAKIVQFRVDRDEVGGGDGDGKTAARRECPIPKPGGIIGELLSLKGAGAKDARERTSGATARTKGVGDGDGDGG